MSNVAFLSGLTGLLNGGLSMYNKQKEWDRQDLLDQMAQENQGFKRAQAQREADAYNNVLDAIQGTDRGSQGTWTGGGEPGQQTGDAGPQSERQRILGEFSQGQPGSAVQPAPVSVQAAPLQTQMPGQVPGQVPASFTPGAPGRPISPYYNISPSYNIWQAQQAMQPDATAGPGSSFTGADAAGAAASAGNGGANGSPIAPALPADAAALSRPGAAQALQRTSRADQGYRTYMALAAGAAAKGDFATAGQFVKQATDQKLMAGYMDKARDIATDSEKSQELVKMIGKLGLPGTTVVTDPDTGVSTIEMAQKDGSTKAVDLGAQNIYMLAMAQEMIKDGNPEGLRMIANVSTDLAARAKGANDYYWHMAQINNQGAQIKGQLTHQQNQEALAANKAQATAAQQVQLGAATAALAANPSDPIAQQQFFAAGGKPADLAHLAGKEGNQPMEVKLAAAFMDAGLAKDKATALRMAMQHKDDSPEQIKRQIYLNNVTKGGMEPKEAMDATDAAMKLLFPPADAGASAGGKHIPDGAISKLKSNPELASAFDQKYGTGMSALVLGGAQTVAQD